MSAIKNFFGIIVFVIIMICVSGLWKYVIPKLIMLGWPAYFLAVLGISMVEVLFMAIIVLLSSPLLYLITTKFAKRICVVITVLILIKTIIYPWEFLSVVGFSFIRVIWGITLNFAVIGTYGAFIYAIKS